MVLYIYLVADNKQKAAAAQQQQQQQRQQQQRRRRRRQRQQQEQRKIDDGAAVLEPSEPGFVVHAHRIGCLLHVLHLFVNAGMGNVFFVGLLGKGCGMSGRSNTLSVCSARCWHNMSRSDVFNTAVKLYKHVVHGGFAIVWDAKFDKPTDTRWMVTWRAAAVLEGRWDQVLWALTCFRVRTEQPALGPVYELLVQALRDAQQSADARALQVCYCARGEGACSGRTTGFAERAAT